MGKGISHPLDADRMLEEDEIKRLENRIDGSPLANEFQAMGIELKFNPAQFRQNGLMRTQLQMWQGALTTDAQRTIMGREVKARSVIGRRLKEDFEQIIRKNKRLHSPFTTSSQLLESNAAKAFNDRGDLLVTRDEGGIAGKFETLFTKATTDPAVMKRLGEAVLEVFEDFQKSAIKSGYYQPFTAVNEWSSQIKSNANSGHPYYAPTSKEEMLTTMYPRFQEWVNKIIYDDSPTDEKKYLTPAPDNAQAGIDTAFTRSPNRLIWAARLLSKLLGFPLNHNLLRMLQDIPASWHDLAQTFEVMANAFGTGRTIIYDDFDSYDLTFHLELMLMILEKFRESTFLSHAPDLRNALDYLIYELTRERELRVSPLHTLHTPVVLPSGSPITQLIGIVVHLAVYYIVRDDYDLGVVGFEVLSDDGIIVVEAEKSGVDRFMANEWNDLVTGIGMKLKLEKSYTASLEDRAVIGEMYGTEIEAHDAAGYLQQMIYDTPTFSHGIIERTIPSLLSTERDGSQQAMDAVLKQHATALTDVREGGDIPKAYYDLNRTISVMASLKPGHPLCDDLIVAVRNGFPNFDKRYSKFRDSIDDVHFDEDVLYAGGTLKSGMTPRWVVDYLDELIGGGDPTVWSSLNL